MARRKSDRGVRAWLGFLGRVVGRDGGKRDRRGLAARSLRMEALEGRALLATDLAAISGTVFRDGPPAGFGAGEQVAGATVNLFVDDGDGVFEPGAGDGSPTVQVTNAQGKYTFLGLNANHYWVQQPAQVVGTFALQAKVSPLINVTALQAQGITGTSIDTFATAGPSITVPAPTGNADGGVQDAPEALGGERDLFATITTAGDLADQVQFRGIAGFLDWSATATAKGQYTAVWDGNDNSSAFPITTNLLNVDLTDGGTSTAIQMRVQNTDKPNGTAQLRLFSSATDFSDSALVVLPEVPATSSDILFPYSSFTLAGGAGADLTSIKAVQLTITANDESMQGRASLVGAVGPTVFTQDFVNSADLSVTKTVNNPTPNVNDVVVFTVTVANAGPDTATSVTVDDDLPAGLAFLSANPSQGSYAAATGIWTVGTLNAAANATLQISATVLSAGLKLNAAEVSGVDQTDPDSTPNNGLNEDDRATASVDPPQIDLSLTKTVNDATPNVGQNVTFTITVLNTDNPNATNDTNATGVAVTDLLPAGLTFVSATPSQGTYASGTGIWTVGQVILGAQATLQIVAQVATPGAKTNTAQVSAANQSDRDSTPGNNNGQEDDQASVIVTPDTIDLSLTKTVDDTTPNRNQNVTFTLTLSNAGPIGATGVTVSDVLPAGLTFVSSTPSAGTYNSATGLWTVGSLANGANATLAIVATVTTSEVKTNTAQVSAANEFDTDSTPNNNNAQEDDQSSVTLSPVIADLSLTKTVDITAPAVNQNVTFTITASNAGPNDASNVTISDPLPAGLTFVSSTASTGTYSNGTGIWTIGALANGASATLSIVAKVASGGQKTNTAEVATSDQFDPDSTPADAQPGQDDRASAVITAPAFLSKRQFLAE